MGNLTMTQKLDEAELQSALTALSEWQLSEDGLSLERLFTFAGFNAAFGFMSRVALAGRTRKSSP